MGTAEAGRLRVMGLRGFLRGEERFLEVGQALVIGRSRRAGLSTRRSKILKARDDWQAVIASEPFLTVSRNHVCIRFLHRHVVEIEDTSANGTYLDGKRITQKLALTDLHRQSHILAFGAREQLKLDLLPSDREPPDAGD